MEWIEQIFNAAQASKGNVVRRCIHDVMRFASMDQLIAAVKARGYHMAIIGEQCVILCRRDGGINVVC